MSRLIIRLCIVAAALLGAAYVVPGIVVADIQTAFVAALFFGVVNLTIRPVLLLFSLPITILTLGLWILVLNSLLFALVAALLPGFEVSGLRAAFFGALLISIAGWVSAALTN